MAFEPFEKPRPRGRPAGYVVTHAATNEGPAWSIPTTLYPSGRPDLTYPAWVRCTCGQRYTGDDLPAARAAHAAHLDDAERRGRPVRR